ncbi:MAG: Trp family transcriptional regulator [Candidatus Paceibacterota bacterium]|jgi:uncharacterized protein YerC
MPHVSSKKINPALLEKLFNKLITVFSRAKDNKSMQSFIDEILTPTEKIMLAKRLAIILMLSGKTPIHKIADTLMVSPTTVIKMSLEIEVGKYNSILNISKNEKDDIEKIIWNILTVGGIMPPKIGRKYWKKYSK